MSYYKIKDYIPYTKPTLIQVEPLSGKDIEQGKREHWWGIEEGKDNFFVYVNGQKVIQVVEFLDGDKEWPLAENFRSK